MKNVEIQVRRWFQKSYGNTYFSGEIYVDGVMVASIKDQYGYGDHGAYELLDAAIEKGALPKRDRQTQALWRYMEDNNIKSLINFVDVKRKKDL